MRKYIVNYFVRILVFSYTVIGLMWFIIEILEHFLPQWAVTLYLTGHIAALIVPGLAGGFLKACQIVKDEILLTYSLRGKKIRIRYGNILNKTDGTILIGVNNQLTTDWGRVVPESIHRQLMDRFGNQEIEKIFKRQREAGGQGRGYFQGNVGNLDIVFLKMSDLEEDGGVHTTIEMLSAALEELFHHQESLTIKNDKIYIPLLGLGKTGASMECNDGVKLIVRKFLQFQAKADGNSADKIKNLEIVIYKDKIRNIDWLKLKLDLDIYFNGCLTCWGGNL
ncbi:MAG: DUF6430 domain-containing protein [Clostridium sp.]|nr:DUF6430 domain-containing protein [Clostridium sp.]